MSIVGAQTELLLTVFQIGHNTPCSPPPPPLCKKKCITIVVDLSWDDCPGEIGHNGYAKFLRGTGGWGGGGKQDALSSM